MNEHLKIRLGERKNFSTRLGRDKAMWEQESEDASRQNPDPNCRNDSRSTARQLAAPLLPTTHHFLETKSPTQPRERKFK